MKTIMEVFVMVMPIVIIIVALFILHKADRIVNSVTSLFVMAKKDLPTSTSEVKESVSEEAPKEIKVTVRENNIQNAEYSGVLHKFARDGVRRERAVMVYVYNGEKVFFEYDEAGRPVNINGQARKSVLKALGGEKVRNFKLYEIEKK